MNFFKRKYYQILTKYLQNKPNKVEEYLKSSYYLKNEKHLNIENPKEISEKIQWLKLNLYTEAYKDYVDKYEVRSHIKKVLGPEYLVDIIGVYDNVDDIDFESLPNKFVMKGTHGSGYNVIVEDKASLDWQKTKRELNKYLSLNYYDKYKELIYKDIKPRILVEHFLDQLSDAAIVDYKFLCFHGEPKYIYAKAEEDGIRKRSYYDMGWNKIELPSEKPNYLRRALDKPENFDEMVETARKLAKDFIFIRVDLYSIQGEIYFGELTFFPKSGMKRVMSEPLNQIMGDLIQLPNEARA